MTILAIVKASSGATYLTEADDSKPNPLPNELARFTISPYYWDRIDFDSIAAAEELAILAFEAGVKYGKSQRKKQDKQDKDNE